ncbi:organic cation transporter protein [Octopus sinensis]|uniref:Organic cation transporter protein n=1 Tax=Octopus sinensis TaxID=2607531 RepID=A0A6P7TEN3_9MOLL|nr:organic cation transporter protein [Octopus sinensis]
MKLDDLLTTIGEFGPYQKKINVLVCIPAISAAIQVIIVVFIMAIPNHRCRIPNLSNDTYDIQNDFHQSLINRTIPFTVKDGVDVIDKCRIYSPSQNISYDEYNRPINASSMKCQSWVYDKSVFESTLVTEMDLVCDKQFASTHAQMSVMGGFLAGAFILGSLSDIIGRRKILLISYLLNICTSIGTTWVPEFISLAVIRFAQGIACAGIITTAFVIGIEIVGPTYRKITGILFEFFFAFGFVLLAGLAYLIRDWEYLELAVSLPSITYIIIWLYIPESPRWLQSQGERERFEDVMRKIAEGNGVEVSPKLFDSLEFRENVKSVPLWIIFTSKKLTIQSLIIFLNWFVVSMVYYGLSLNSVNLGGNIFLNFFFIGLAEFPAYFLCILIIDKVGRKPVYCTSMILGGISCVSSLVTMMYLKEYIGFTIALTTFGKFNLAASFAVIYVISGELFPTVIRNGAVGTSSCFARIGGMVAPYVAEASNVLASPYNQLVPSLCFGISAIIAGCFALILPETLNRHLPDDIAEAENQESEGSSILDKRTLSLSEQGNHVQYTELKTFDNKV